MRKNKMKYYLIDNRDKFYVFDEDTCVLTCLNENSMWPTTKELHWDLDIEKYETAHWGWFKNPWWRSRELKVLLPHEVFIEALCNE